MTEDTPRRVSGCSLVAVAILLALAAVPPAVYALADVIWT